jgi:hypothetical protein
MNNFALLLFCDVRRRHVEKNVQKNQKEDKIISRISWNNWAEALDEDRKGNEIYCLQ